MWQNVDEKTEAQDFQFCFIDRPLVEVEENKIIVGLKHPWGQCDLFRIVDQAMQQQKQNLRNKIPQQNPNISQAGICYPV